MITGQSSVLIVFVKNLRRGKVKTRLAESVGEEKALQIYRRLLNYTASVIEPLKANIQIWFSDHIPKSDFWDDMIVEKKVQQEGDLGDRMKHACFTAFNEGYEKSVVIGSDCAELTTAILNEAFDELERNNVVIGPTKDGGYYLIGMTGLYPQLFDDMPWSTSGLFQQTINTIESEGIAYSLLETLNDVDTVEDWNRIKNQFRTGK